MRRINIGFRLACENCEAVLNFDREHAERELPLTILCSMCGEETTLTKFPVERKYDSPCMGRWLPAGQHESPNKDKGDPASFIARCKQLGDNLHAGLTMIEDMRKDLQRLAEAMASQFSEQWDIGDTIGRGWQPAYLYQFIQRPFLSIPAEASDAITAFYSRYLFSPIFLDLHYGFPVIVNNGFRIELINGYSRLSTPLPNWLCDTLDIPPSLELEVYGNKIIGKSLSACWQDIPGITEDDDHQDDMPSIRISKSKEARQWLVKHGVPSWQPREIPLADLGMYESYLELREHPLYCRAWPQLIRNGRLLLTWPDIQAAIKFCLIYGSCHHAHTMVISADLECQQHWKSVFMGSQGTTRYKLLHTDWEDYRKNIDGLKSLRNIIVDYRSGVPLEFMEKLYQYPGNLIVIHDDPIMDCLDSNEEAAILYGLCGRSSCQYTELESEFRKVTLPEGNRLRESLRKMQMVVARKDSADVLLNQLTENANAEFQTS